MALHPLFIRGWKQLSAYIQHIFMTNQTFGNNKRIAQNTIALYFRTLITMAVGLYTSRVVLNVLGVEDYGIYNVVGGVVAMFNIVTASLSQAISRYITFELGKENNKRLHAIFCTSVNIQILMSFVVLLLAECLGVWFLNGKMNIPPERMHAANWVFQFSIFTFIVDLISVPYNAAIIAHEKMKAFAYVGVLEAFLKLAVVGVLLISPIDYLIVYAFMVFVVAIAIRIVYGIYCKKNFVECSYSFIMDRCLLKEMTGFAGWNTIAATAFIFNTQGINILCNLFFGVSVNAARGIATQVESIVRGFVMNFTTAVRPQIIKCYSSGEHKYMFDLLCTSTKFSYFLMFVFAMPFMFEADYILRIWLTTYPPLAPCFVRLSMIVTLSMLLGEMFFTNVLAIGKLKRYMISECAVTFFIFPLSYIMFSLGAPSFIPYVFFAFAYCILVIIRICYLHREEKFPISKFMNSVVVPVGVTTGVSVVILIYLCDYIVFNSEFLTFMCRVFFCLLVVCGSILLFGLTKSERKYLISRFWKK